MTFKKVHFGISKWFIFWMYGSWGFSPLGAGNNVFYIPRLILCILHISGVILQSAFQSFSNMLTKGSSCQEGGSQPRWVSDTNFVLVSTCFKIVSGYGRLTCDLGNGLGLWTLSGLSSRII